MTQRKRRTSATRKRKGPEVSPLYLGCFYFDSFDERVWTGTFQIVVEAISPEQAVERFQARLRKLRASKTLFSKPTTIYIEGLIELAGAYQRGLLVNYESGYQSLPDARLTNMIPGQDDHKAVAYGWRAGPPGRKPKNGEDIDPFLDFGGKAALRARNAEEARLADRHTQLASGRRQDPAAEKRNREEAQAAAKTRKERREVLAATVRELRGK